MRRAVVGVGDVVDRHRFRAVLLADPVGVRKVDSDRRGGVAVAAEHRHGDDLGRDALDDLFLVGGVDGRVVFEPLGVLGDDPRAAAGRRVDEVDVGLPRSLVPQRIAVGLDESVDEVDVRHRVLQPEDVVAVELFQVARAVVVDQGGEGLLLRLGRYVACLFEPVDDAFDRGRVHASDLPRAFVETSRLLLLDQLRVQTVGDGAGVACIGCGHRGVELFGLVLAHVAVIVAGRRPEHIGAGCLIEPRGVDRRVEDDLAEKIEIRRKAIHAYRCGRLAEEGFRKLGAELVVGIVVVDAVGEPHFFEVFFERFPLVGRAVSFIIKVERFERAPDRQVGRAVLVEEDVATALGRFGQVVDQLFLFERKPFESGHFVADDLDVVEPVDDPRLLRVGGRRVRARTQTCDGCCHKRNKRERFHLRSD